MNNIAKRQHLGIRFVLLPLLLALPACGKRAADPRGVDREETLLTVSATGRSEATPDQALFTAGLSTVAADPQAASGHNAETMTKIAASLKLAGIPSRDIQTRSLSVNRISYGADKGQYQANNTVSVRVRNVARVAQAIASVTATGANIVSGPNLSLVDPEKASLGAYGAAYRAARAKAEAYASAADLRVERVLAIRDSGGGNFPPMITTQQAMAPPPVIRGPAPPAPPVEAGINTNVVTVQVDFALGRR